jgi:hypothetical protein
MNPELRQTLNTISRNFESANEAAQENIYTFTQLLIDPCVSGFKNCFTQCTAPCFPKRENRLRRRRARSRGRSDLHFDFYDDWEDEEDDTYGAGSWGNDELDSLLAGRGSGSRQPGRQRGMSYGTKNRRPAHAPNEENPNIIPSSSYLGFLERFKWRPGAKGLRYKPSAADLQEHPVAMPGALGREEVEPLIEESEEDEAPADSAKHHRRNRSDTQASGSTTNSLSSRGDLIMGDEEEDAQPLDDEFAVMLTRQNTGSSRRPGTSRQSIRTASSKSTNSRQSSQAKRSNSGRNLQPISQSPMLDRTEVQPPSIVALRAEEDHLRREQEMEVAQKREDAMRLAKDRRLESDMMTMSTESIEIKTPENEPEHVHQHETVEQDPNRLTLAPTSPSEAERRLGHASSGYLADSETEPFPSFPTTPVQERPP